MTQKLNQIIAIEKSVKTKVKAEQSEIYAANQKPNLFNGFTKVYTPFHEQGEKFPPESMRVQFSANEQVRAVGKRLAELLDVTATKDYANCHARADVVVDGEVVVKDAPVTYLLFLEKEITDMATFLGKLPTLDPAEQWDFDEKQGLFRTGETKSFKSKKVQKPLVLYPATDKHPAQTQLVTEDENIGEWKNTKLSGAVPNEHRKALVARAEKLISAIKMAREQANMADAPEKDVGKAIMAWLLK